MSSFSSKRLQRSCHKSFVTFNASTENSLSILTSLLYPDAHSGLNPTGTRVLLCDIDLQHMGPKCATSGRDGGRGHPDGTSGRDGGRGYPDGTNNCRYQRDYYSALWSHDLEVTWAAGTGMMLVSRSLYIRNQRDPLIISQTSRLAPGSTS